MNTITPKIFSEITAQVAAAIDDAYTSRASRFADAESFLKHTNRKLDEIIERFASLGGLEPDLVMAAVAGSCETWMQLNGERYGDAIASFLKEKHPIDPATCRVCGCTESDCTKCIQRTGSPCHWVEPDLCSACVGPSPLVRGITAALPMLFELPEGSPGWPD